MKKVYTLTLLLLLSTPIFAQIGVINSPPILPDELAQRLVGYGLEVTNAQLLCPDNASGYFFGGETAGLPMNSGIMLTSGTTAIGLSPNTVGGAGINNGGPGYAPLEEFPWAYNGTFNACVLEFDFIPQGDSIKFNFVFGSEEYPEYVGSVFNDIFAFLISGMPEYPEDMAVTERNIAIIPTSPGIHVAINFLNFASYSNYYIDNSGGNFIQYDGYTTNITAKAKVTPCNTYHLELAIADVSDGIFDSGVFLEEGSFISNTFFVEDAISNISTVEELDFVVENCGEGTVTFNTEFPNEEGYSLPLIGSPNSNIPDAVVVGGSATLFVDYTLSDNAVVIGPNETEASIDIYPVVDGLAEDDEFITFAFYSSCDPIPYQIDTFWIYDEIKAVVNDDIDVCDPGTEVQLNGWESNGINLERDRFFIRWEPAAGLSCTDCLDPIATVNSTTTYTFIIGYDGTICSDQESVTINVDPNTTNFAAIPEFSICSNQVVELSATGGIEYTWLLPSGDPATNLSCTDCPNPTFTPPNDNTATYAYEVVVSSGPGCSEVFPVEIIVDLAELNVEQPNPICPGDMATLSITGGDGSNFVWTRTNGLPAGIGTSIEVSPDVTTTYSVVATDVTCPYPQTVTVYVDQVDAAFNPVQAVCAGEAATLVGQGGGEYQWLDTEGNVVSTNQTFNPIVEENTTYILVAQTNNCFDSIPVLVPIEPIREIQFITENPVICGDVTSIDLAIEPIPGVTFVWEPAGAFTMNSEDGSVVTATPPTDGFTYTVTAVTDLACTPPESISVTVGSELEITVDAPEVLCIDLANPQPYTVNAFGAATYTWSPFGPIIPLANGSSQAFLFPNPENNNVEIIVVGEDEEGNCMGQTSFMVQVFQEPEMIIAPPVICEGEAGTMTVDIVGGSGEFEYEWFPPTGLSNPNGRTTEVTIDEPIAYTLLMTDLIAGCELQQEVVVEVSPIAEINAPEVIVACNGEEITIEAQIEEGFEGIWSHPDGSFAGAGSSISVTPNASTTYTLTVGTDCPVEVETTVEIIDLEINASASATQICDGEEVQLIAEGTGIVDFVWEQANGLQGTEGAMQTATPTGTTTYIVTGFSAGGLCEISTEVTVEVANIQVQIPPDPSTCGADDPAILNIDGGEGASYNWTPSTGLSSTTEGSVTAAPSQTTTYNVQVINQQGCEENVVVTVNVFPPIEITIDPPIMSLCPGETATYTLAGAENYDIEEINGNPFQILSNADGQIEISANADASFHIIGTDENGCSAETAAELIINEPIVSIGENPTICFGEEVQLFADGGAGATYQWNNAETLDDANSPTPTASPDQITSYTVTITDNNGCSTTEQVTVVVESEVIAQLTALPNDICPGTAVVLSAGENPNSEFTYTFYDGNNQPIAENNNGQTVIIPTESTTYSLIVTTPLGCENEALATVTFNENPVLEAQNGVACPDGSTIMNVQGPAGTVYEWTPNSIISCDNPECSQVTVTPTSAIPVVFNITGTTPAGCVSETQASVSVEAALEITVSPPNPELCLGETITLSAGGATQFQWEGPGLSATTGSSVEVVLDAANTYEYTLTGLDGDCSGSTTFSVVINEPPIIEAVAAPMLCVGDTHTLEANGGVTYEWTLNGEAVTNLEVAPTVTTTYDVVGIDENGCSNISQVTIEVEEPIDLNVTTNDDVICLGGQTSIMATGAVSFEWSTTDTTGDGELLTVSPTQTTTYTVIATSANGCQTEGEVTVEVLEPQVSLAANQTSFCLGENATLEATGTGNYSWEGEGISGSGSNISVTPPESGLYAYTVTTDINGCIATAEIEIEVFAEPEVIVPQFLQICKDGSTDITATGADTYEWIDPNGSLSTTTGEMVTASPTAGTTYTVIGTTSDGCSASAEITVEVSDELILDAPNQEICGEDADGITLTVSGAQNYTWSGDVASLSATDGNTVVATPSVTTTYTIVGTDEQGCSGETQVTVVVNELPQADAGEEGRICIGDSFNLEASGGVQYIWDDPTGTLSNNNIANPVATPTEPTTYTVTVINENGCSSTSEVLVDLEPLATASVPALGEICSNALFDIVGASAENALSVTWTSSGNGSFLDANSLETSYQPDESDVGTVTLTLHVEGCGMPSESFDIEVNESTAKLEIDPVQAVCPGEEIRLFGANTGSGEIANVNWSGGLGSFDDPTSLNPTYTPALNETNDITFILSADDECGTVSAPITATILPLITMDAGLNVTINEGETIRLEGNGAGNNADSYIWAVAEESDPEMAGLDASEINSPTPSVTPSVTTTYQLSSGDACSDIDFVDVIVLPAGQIVMPNAFSPNNDGFNDVIFPVGDNFELLDFRIYNRWGQEVFQTNQAGEGWDGFFEGEPAELGVYAYVVEYSLGGSSVVEILSGSITLIR